MPIKEPPFHAFRAEGPDDNNKDNIKEYIVDKAIEAIIHSSLITVGDELLTAEQARRILQMKRLDTVHRLIRDKKLKAHWVGRWLIWKSDLIDFINSQ